MEQLHKIFKLCGSPSEEYWKRSKLPHATIFKPQNPYKRCVTETFKDFPHSTLALLDVLLAIEPEGRGSASSALKSEVNFSVNFCSMIIICQFGNLSIEDLIFVFSSSQQSLFPVILRVCPSTHQARNLMPSFETRKQEGTPF